MFNRNTWYFLCLDSSCTNYLSFQIVIIKANDIQCIHQKLSCLLLSLWRQLVFNYLNELIQLFVEEYLSLNKLKATTRLRFQPNLKLLILNLNNILLNLIFQIIIFRLLRELWNLQSISWILFFVKLEIMIQIEIFAK